MFKSPTQRLWQILSFLTAIAISVFILINRDRFGELETYGYVGIFVLSLLGNATVIVPAPAFLTALIGGGLFDPFWVGIISAAGATLGEMTGYLVGAGGRMFTKDKKFERVNLWIEKKGFGAIVVLAAIPNPLFDLAGIVSGFLKYPVWKFLTATFLGKAVKFLALAYIGAGSVKLLF